MNMKQASLEHSSIAIPTSRDEAMLLAQETLNQLSFIERCIDEAIEHCRASSSELALAA